MYSGSALLDDDLYFQSDFRRKFAQRGWAADGRDCVKYGAVEIKIIPLRILKCEEFHFRIGDGFAEFSHRKQQFLAFAAEVLDLDSQEIAIAYQIEVFG